MIQPIYTSVSNANTVSCGKKGHLIQSDPIPLLRDKYLGEYRTELEKAKVRKNLGIGDEYNLQWGNIGGFIEQQKDLINYVEQKWSYTNEISSSITNVKEALDYTIYFISNFKSDTESIIQLQKDVITINEEINQVNKLLSETEKSLQESIDLHSQNIENLSKALEQTNNDIKKLNEDLININVDSNILAWVKKATSNSIQLIDDSRLEVKISETENNALHINDDGLFVSDLSEQVNQAQQNIEGLQTEVSEINTTLDTFVTKEDLGGDGDFNFVNQDVFEQHVNQANTKFGEIDKELERTVKTGEDGHVDTLYVNTLSNQEGNIKINKSFEVQSGIPLDVRTVVKSVEDLYKLSPKTAYTGMAVANAGDGNIYMLMDPTRITEKGGWKASYESLQIVTCTQEEYDAMAANTNDDYTPKQEGLPFLYRDTYYYIYENDQGQYYLSSSWGKEIEEELSTKASNDSVTNLLIKVNNVIKDLSDNYTTTETLLVTYVQIESLKEMFNQDNPDSYISKLLSNYYTINSANDTFVDKQSFENFKTEVTEDYVTKEMLKGSDTEDTDFIFVTQKQYSDDNKAKALEFTTQKLVLNASVNLSADDDRIVTENNTVAYLEEVPKIECMTQTQYDNLVESGEVEEDTYYYTYDETNDPKNTYITLEYLQTYYLPKQEVEQMIYDATQALLKRIEALELLHPVE